MQLKAEDICKAIEKCNDFVLILDDNERILYAGKEFLDECGVTKKNVKGIALKVLLEEFSSKNWAGRAMAFSDAMSEARNGRKGTLNFASKEPDLSYSISYGYTETSEGGIAVFCGTMIHCLGNYTEWEKGKRIRELSCLYAVADWIDRSATISEFFTELPKYLATGMHFPDDVMVYSKYQGQDYGIKLDNVRNIQTTIIISGKDSGLIQIGYASGDHGFLSEEQRMLDEIGRMLSLALERRDLRDNLVLKQDEEAELKTKLVELETEINLRTSELENQTKKLDTVNSYLDRLSRDWEETQVRLETMFLAVPDKVALIDRNRNIVMSNRPDIKPGGKCYQAIFNRDVPCKDCRLQRIIKKRTPITIEVTHDDTFYEVHALPVFSQDHEVEGIIEFYRDITKEKNYKKQLQQADKLASLGQLVSGIGHEINNPNQFIKGNIKIIEQALDDILPIIDGYYKDNPDLKIARLKYDFFRQHIGTLVKDMSHGSERIKSIVEGLRGFARKDEGLLIDEVDVNTIIDASARLCYNQLNKTADIELNLTKDIPSIIGNTQKIEQVAINLMMNAGQAIPEGRRGVIAISTRSDSDSVIIEIKDNGKGMNERTLKKIFDPFFTTRRSRGGTGLGLAIVYGIIEEHGGTISVSSKVDVGTTFTIMLPIKREVSTSSVDSLTHAVPE